jgi:hypothetical protein
MSVFFDYSARLMTAVQLEQVKIAEIVNSTTDTDYYPWFQVSVSGTDDVAFYSVVNPGHAGTTSLLEYRFYTDVYIGSVTAYSWQIKASGGAWADIVTGTDLDSVFLSGYYTTPVLLPCEIQLLTTGTAALSFGYDLGASLRRMCAVRCIGTV